MEKKIWKKCEKRREKNTKREEQDRIKFKRNEKIIFPFAKELRFNVPRKQRTEKTLSNCVNFIIRISRTKPLNREAYARPLLLPALSTDCFTVSLTVT